jgi:2'-5' RNA ligase
MRIFISVDIEDREVIYKIENVMKKLDSSCVKKVNSNQLHITLFFIGETKNPMLYAKVLDEIRFKKFKVNLKGIGAFPNAKNPRIIWIGVFDNGELNELHYKIEDKIGVSKSLREFHPHLTIGRVKCREGLNELRVFLKKYESEYFGEIYIEKIKLKESVLKKEGPVYKDLVVRVFEG